MLGFLAPDYLAERITDISLDFLSKNEIRNLIIDLDNTLAKRDADFLEGDCYRWLKEAKRKGFNLMIVSNNWQLRANRALLDLSNEVEVIAPAGKPFLKRLKKGIKRMNFDRNFTVFIGDQVFTDILGAKRLGVKSILVLPLSSYDLPHTRFLRKIEKKLISRWIEKGKTQKLLGSDYKVQ